MPRPGDVAVPGPTVQAPSMHVVVVGLGYIGLPTAAVLAAAGHRVTGVDIDPGIVSAVNDGRVPFTEPDLDVAVSAAVSSGHLRASVTMAPADAYIVAVPTPVREDRTPDLGYVMSAAAAVAPHLSGGALVVLESTSPPGTTEAMAGHILSLRPDLAIAGSGDGRPEIHVAHCPERVLPGRIMTEIVTNDRVVGGVTPECARRAADLYRSATRGAIVETDARTAELAKLAENSFRDVNIAFANELAGVCQALGIDVWRLIEIANRHPRVEILRPGPGVGGHCIAVDPWFVVAAAPDVTPLIRTARAVNDGRPAAVVDAILAALPFGRPATVACLGLTFKADVEDMRESPALHIAVDLAKRVPQDVRVLAVEPHASGLPAEAAAAGLVMAGLEAIDEADVVALLVDHREFVAVSRDRLSGKAVIDTRGIWRETAREIRL